MDKFVWEAIQKAEEAFYKHLEKKGVDGAYWTLDIEVDALDIDFEGVVERYKWSNKQKACE